jgi:hypothetical protein
MANSASVAGANKYLKQPNDSRAANDAFFNETTIRTFKIEIPQPALLRLRQSPRTYVSATVTEGNRALTNVAIHLKGMGSFRPLDDKPSFTVNFDRFATNQEYRGLTRLQFNNSAQDPSYLAELLSTQLFRDADVPAARVTHARVQLNGRDLGLYVVIEGMNKRFLKRHFNNAQGNLYEGYLADINDRLEQDNGERTDQSDLRALLAACLLPNLSERWSRLNTVLDVDRFVSFAAMEMLASAWDGYAIHTNNYRIYHDPASDKMVFITHGLDWAFRRPNISIEPPRKGIVARAVLETPEGLKLYRERIGTLFTNAFRVAVITNRIENALAKIRGANLPATELATIERRATWMRQQIEARDVSVRNQLAGIPSEPLKFDANGIATLRRSEQWRDEPDRGEPVMDRPQAESKKTLHIQATGTRATRASWRSQVYLPRGFYRFEGAACVEGRGGFARLRISGDTQAAGFSGATGWLPLSHDFEVPDAGMDIELICEFLGSQGEVWFDLDSLRLRRITPAEVQRLDLRRRTQ